MTTDANPNDGSGGTWYLVSGSTQSFNYQTSDIEMDVRNMLKVWMSGSLPNDGMILKHSDSKENDTQDYGIVKLFSKLLLIVTILLPVFTMPFNKPVVVATPV